MLQPVESSRNSKRLSREDWLSEALEFLAGGGELRIDRLTEALGVTKGSFYHHFRDRADFIDAVLDYWHRVCNLSVQAAMEETAPESASDRLRVLMRTVFQRELGKYDMPVRAWALENPRVQQYVQLADDWRMKFVRPLFEELGFTNEELDIRCRVFLTFAAFETALYIPLDMKAKEKQFEARFLFFTSP